MVIRDSEVQATIVAKELKKEQNGLVLRAVLVAILVLSLTTLGGPIPLLVPLSVIGLALLASAGTLLFLRSGRLPVWAGYVSLTVDLLLIFAGMLLAYGSGTDPFLPLRAGLVFLVIAATSRRYYPGLGLFAGIAGALMHSGMVFLLPLLDTSVAHPAGPALLNHLLLIALYLGGGIYASQMARKRARTAMRDIKLKRELDILQAEHKLLHRVEEGEKKYLENISQGLLSFNSRLIINEAYSIVVRSMFGRSRVDGARFPDFIFGEDEKNKKVLLDYLDIMFNRPELDNSTLHDLNPLKRLEYSHPDGDTRYLDIRFKKVMSGEKCTEVITTIDDVTRMVLAERRLQEEQEKHQEDIEIISAILQMSLKEFDYFHKEGREAIQKISALLAKLFNSGRDQTESIIYEIFRIAHTLKSNARLYKLNTLEKRAHMAEDFFRQLKESNDTAAQELLDEAKNCINKLEEAFHSLEEIGKKFAAYSRKTPGDGDSGYDSFLNYVHSLKDMCLSMSNSLGKIFSLRTSFSLDDFPPKLVQVIKNPVNHLIRNAADHGIDDPETRKELGKRPTGLIQFDVVKEGESIIVSVEDDGSGIDVEKISQSASRLGLKKDDQPLSREEAIKMIFRPGFSSREEAGLYSGRGTGLDAVKDMVKKRNGRITIHSDQGKGTRISLIYPKTAFQ